MSTMATVSWRLAEIGWWAARILGTLLALLFLAFFLASLVGSVATGNWAQLTFHDILLLVGLLLFAVGLLLAWTWEGLGGLLGIAGFVLSVALTPNAPRNLLLLLPASVALVHLVCWNRLRAGAPAELVPWRLSRRLLAVPLALLAVFLLLCVNDLFIQPPLMRPALHPSGDLTGTWYATPQMLPNGVTLTIHPDGMVTGSVGGSEITEAHIDYDRSWFGEEMHWNDDYLIAGSLADEIQGSVPAGGKQIAIFLNESEPHTLTGYIMSGREEIEHRLIFVRDKAQLGY